MSEEINKVDLDNWITGHWGEDQRQDDEPDNECPTCGYSDAEWRGEAACSDKWHYEKLGTGEVVDLGTTLEERFPK